MLRFNRIAEIAEDTHFPHRKSCTRKSGYTGHPMTAPSRSLRAVAPSAVLCGFLLVAACPAWAKEKNPDAAPKASAILKSAVNAWLDVIEPAKGAAAHTLTTRL